MTFHIVFFSYKLTNTALLDCLGWLEITIWESNLMLSTHTQWWGNFGSKSQGPRAGSISEIQGEGFDFGENTIFLCVENGVNFLGEFGLTIIKVSFRSFLSYCMQDYTSIHLDLDIVVHICNLKVDYSSCTVWFTLKE